MPAHELLVEMLRREVGVTLPIKLVHAFELALRRAPWRHLADPPIAQTLDPAFLVTNTQPAEMASRHAQQFSRFLSGQPLTLVLLECLFKTRHKNLP